MTYIDHATADELVSKLPGDLRIFKWTPHETICVLMNAAITHYLNSVKAGMPEADAQVIPTGNVVTTNNLLDRDLPNSTLLYAADTVAKLIATAEGHCCPDFEMTPQPNLCTICGEPMDSSERMFKHHGYSGTCPKPPLKKVQLDAAGVPKLEMTILEREAVKLLNNIKAATDGGLIQLPIEMQMGVDVVLTVATMRRVGVA